MRANPKPHEPVSDLDSKSAVVTADAGRPKTGNPLEGKRWMTRVLFDALVGLNAILKPLSDASCRGPAALAQDRRDLAPTIESAQPDLQGMPRNHAFLAVKPALC